MPLSRTTRAALETVRFAAFLVLAVAAVRGLLGVVASRGWGPGAFFWLLLVTGAVALTWRAALELRKRVRRARG